jgi:hypothetical protein
MKEAKKKKKAKKEKQLWRPAGEVKKIITLK